MQTFLDNTFIKMSKYLTFWLFIDKFMKESATSTELEISCPQRVTYENSEWNQLPQGRDYCWSDKHGN
jgi:hypothetical protein